MTDEAVEEIIFRAEHGVLQSLAPYPRAQRVALLPSVVRMLLTTFLEELARADGSPRSARCPLAGAPTGLAAARRKGAERERTNGWFCADRDDSQCPAPRLSRVQTLDKEKA